MHKLSVVLGVAAMAASIAGSAAALNPQPLPPRCLPGAHCPQTHPHPEAIGACKHSASARSRCDAAWNECLNQSGGDTQICLQKWRSCCA